MFNYLTFTVLQPLRPSCLAEYSKYCSACSTTPIPSLIQHRRGKGKGSGSSNLHRFVARPEIRDCTEIQHELTKASVIFSSALAAHAYIFMQTHFKFAFGLCTTSWLCASRKQSFNLCGLTPTSTLKFDYEVLSSSKLKIAKWNTIKTNEFSLAWCQKWEKLHILHALGIELHGNISKALIILSGDFSSHVLHSLAHINHKSGTSVQISIIFDTILLSSVWLNTFYIEFQSYKQFNNSAFKLSICRNACKAQSQFWAMELLISGHAIVTLCHNFPNFLLLFFFIYIIFEAMSY